MRNHRQLFLFAVTLLWGFDLPASGEVISHREIGLEFWVPDDWPQGREGDFLVISDPAQTLKLVFIPSELQFVDRFSEALSRELSRVIDQPEVDRETNVEINGLFHYRAEGIGLYKGELTDWSLAFITGPRKCVLIVILGDARAHQRTLEEIYHSMELITYELEEDEVSEGAEEAGQKPHAPPPPRL